MQPAIRTVGIGLGFFVGFVCLCYFVGWLLIKYSESARDIFESEFEDVGQRFGTFLFGLASTAVIAFVVFVLYAIGTIFV